MPEARNQCVVVACFTADSGLTDYSVSLARELAKSFPVVFVTGQNLSPHYRRLGFEVVNLFRRSRWYPIDLIRFAWWCVGNRPRALSLQAPLKVPLLDGLAVRLLRAFGVRCVLTVHDVLPHYPRFWSAKELAWFYRCFDALVAHSDVARAQLKRMAPAVPVISVPHGVYDIFRRHVPARSAARALIGLAPESGATKEFCVLFFGHLEPRKGLEVFLRVARRLQAEGGVRFVVAGAISKSHCTPALLLLFDEARTWSNVTVREGRVPFEEVENYFCAADTVVLPYLEGSTSGVLKLAIAFGVPVVATRVGDLAEQVPDQGGILIDLGDNLEDTLLDAVLRARTQGASLRRGMAEAAESGDWQKIAIRYSELLSDEQGLVGA